MNLLDNLTFAVLVNDGNWKTDLTIRFCEYFSHKINGDNFLKNIIFPATVDDALEDCCTGFLLVQLGGHIPFSESFFDKLEKVAEENKDIFLGHIESAHDYLLISNQCIFVNIKLWRDAGKPAFTSQVREGPRFLPKVNPDNKDRPFSLLKDHDNSDRIFVPHQCSISGANMIIQQMEIYGEVRSLSDVMDKSEIYYLDNASPYHEIHSETFFEKKLLSLIRTNVFALEDDDMSHLKNITADIVVAPAQGLKPANLVKYFNAKKLVVYDSNPLSLELQKLIFSIDTPTLYGDIVAQFQEDFPNALVVDGWDRDEFTVVDPVKIEIEYHVADVFSFEIEDLVRSIDHKPVAVFDLSDIFVYPYNYYRRPLYQVQGLFAEIYSLMKSRSGPTHILGYAPGFQNMDKIEVNTSVAQFQMDPTIDPTIVDEDSIQEVVEVPEVMFKPPPVEVAPIVEETFTPPIAQEDAVVEPVSILAPAFEAGYARVFKTESLNGSSRNISVLTKTEVFEEFTAIFEYFIDETVGDWSFRIGKEGVDKRIEFSNGQTIEGFQKHLNLPKKINPKTAVKYFQNK